MQHMFESNHNSACVVTFSLDLDSRVIINRDITDIVTHTTQTYIYNIRSELNLPT